MLCKIVNEDHNVLLNFKCDDNADYTWRLNRAYGAGEIVDLPAHTYKPSDNEDLPMVKGGVYVVILNSHEWKSVTGDILIEYLGE